jgi:hypothetical protein
MLNIIVFAFCIIAALSYSTTTKLIYLLEDFSGPKLLLTF